MSDPTYRQDLFNTLKSFRADYSKEFGTEYDLDNPIHRTNNELEDIIIEIGWKLGYNKRDGSEITETD